MAVDSAPMDATPALDLKAMLDLLAQTVVNALGFAAVAVNLVESDERVTVVSVAGPEGIRESLVGSFDTLSAWEDLLESGEPWGRLVFLDHTVVGANPVLDMVSWVPDVAAVDDPEAWHPEDSLFAPLRGRDGSLLGILSVDLPRAGRRPDNETRKSLEAFGVSAALAIEHATLRARAEESEELFREVFSASPLGMALLDGAGVIVMGNDALCRFLERTPSELVGHRLGDFRHPDDTRRELDAVEPDADIERFVRTDGSVVYGELTQTLLHGGRHVVTQLRDVTDQREAVSRLQHLATHDAATGVGNRSLLLQRLRSAITEEDRAQDRIALLFIDLDGFKRINDDFSHAVGDEVLRTVAQRLLAVVRPDDCVVRWGGDEFIVMVHPLPEARAALDLAGRIGEALSAPVCVGEDRAILTSSIGVAYSDADDGLDVDDLLRNADTAMYRAKQERRSSFFVFDAELRERSARRRQVERLVADSSEDRVAVHYQPIVRIDTGSVRAVECLLRLRDDDGGLLYPGSFLSTAQKTGHLRAMETVALRRACEQVASWAAMGCRLRVSVNVGLGRLDEVEAFADAVHGSLAEFGLPGRALVLEISERSFNGVTAHTLKNMQTLANSGLHFSVDDFGMGSATWTYLRTMPVHEIKIHKSFVQQSAGDRVSMALLRAHSALASELGIRCVAMGVETLEQQELVRQADISLAQGFLYEQPLGAEAMTEFLLSRATSTPRLGQRTD